MTGYADTSFLVSLYLPDVHSPVAWAAMKSRPHLYLTPLHELELVNAIRLAVFRKLIRRIEAGFPRFGQICGLSGRPR